MAEHPYKRDRYSRKGDLAASAIIVMTVLLLFAVAVTLFFGSSYVISTIADNPMFNIINAKAEVPASIPPPVTKIDTTSLTPTPAPSPTPTWEITYAKVANTDGDGVFLRRTPRSADRILPWNDGTVMEVIGPDREAEGMVWRNVKDPKGNVGWIPSQYLVDAGP